MKTTCTILLTLIGVVAILSLLIAGRLVDDYLRGAGDLSYATVKEFVFVTLSVWVGFVGLFIGYAAYLEQRKESAKNDKVVELHFPLNRFGNNEL